MKYGLDVNIPIILDIVKKKLVKNGHCIVDLTKSKYKSKGEIVFRKSLLANMTNIDYHIVIEFIEDFSKFEIYFNEDSKLAKCYGILNLLFPKEYNLTINTSLKDLYLVKKIGAPTLYLKVPLKFEKEIINNYLDDISDIISNI